MQDMVKRSISGSGEDPAEWDVDAIVDEIKSIYGLIDTSRVPDKLYWAIVERHAAS
jgi:hypothetical protein